MINWDQMYNFCEIIMPQQSARIAIIGAGMAGLAALEYLGRQGHDVDVFDKSRGSGGRLASKRGQHASWDMGAQFLTGTHPEFLLQLECWRQQGWIEPWDITPWVVNNKGANPSPDDRLRYVAVPRMTALSRELLAPARHFHTATRIIAIQRHQQQWTLQSENGDTFTDYDAVVIALPPAQAALLAGDYPQLAKACEVAMAPCWTLLLAMPASLPVPWHAAFVHNQPIGWIARNNSKPGREASPECWVIQASHEWSKTHIDSPRADVEQQLLSSFSEAIQVNQPLPIIESWLHRWLYAIPDMTSGARFRSDNQAKLALCGDWLHAPNIEGAWLSGCAAAAEIHQQLQRGDT